MMARKKMRGSRTRPLRSRTCSTGSSPEVEVGVSEDIDLLWHDMAVAASQSPMAVHPGMAAGTRLLVHLAFHQQRVLGFVETKEDTGNNRSTKEAKRAIGVGTGSESHSDYVGIS
jgi:hypothetical protein